MLTHKHMRAHNHFCVCVRMIFKDISSRLPLVYSIQDLEALCVVCLLCMYICVCICVHIRTNTHTYTHSLSLLKDILILFSLIYLILYQKSLDIIQNFPFFSYYHPVFHCLRRKWKENFAFL